MLFGRYTAQSVLCVLPFKAVSEVLKVSGESVLRLFETRSSEVIPKALGLLLQESVSPLLLVESLNLLYQLC